MEEGRKVWQAGGNKPNEAAAWSQLAIIYFRLGDLAAAERHAHKARQIREALYLREVWKDYHTLSEIAKARGDLTDAAGWTNKRDDLTAEPQRRAGGRGSLPVEMLKALQTITLACAQAGFGGSGLRPFEEEAISRLRQFPDPFPDFATFLHQLAAGQLPPIPSGLPAEFLQGLEQLVEAIRETRR